MGIERRRALRSRPPSGPRIAVHFSGSSGLQLTAHLFDLSEVGLGCLFTRDAAQLLSIGGEAQVQVHFSGANGSRFLLDCPVVVRQTRPMAASFLIGLELKLDGQEFALQRANLRRIVEQWLHAAHEPTAGGDQSKLAG